MNKLLAVIILILSSSFVYAQNNGLDRSKFNLSPTIISKNSFKLYKTEDPFVPEKRTVAVGTREKADDGGEDWTWNGTQWTRPMRQSYPQPQPMYFQPQPPPMMPMMFRGGGGFRGGGNCGPSG
jgi:hypothetical protein